ncbi:hypothetical protein [Rheinheimera sp.]|uniref:hypothetical protein n=1 Tax=Rheinheimera sp. TaxID=1869214 RepID=UPI003D286C01
MDLVEQNRVREEEIFRHEIRKNLELPRSKYNTILGFFNSGLGLWLLSTVSVSVVTGVYSLVNNNIKQSQFQMAQEDMLSLEINARISQWKALTMHLRKQSDYIEPVHFRKHWSELLAPPVRANGISSNVQPVFPEFQSRGILSLTYELHGITKPTMKSEYVEKTEKEIRFLIEWDPISLGYTSIDSYLRELKKYPMCLHALGEDDSDPELDSKCK